MRAVSDDEVRRWANFAYSVAAKFAVVYDGQTHDELRANALYGLWLGLRATSRPNRRFLTVCIWREMLGQLKWELHRRGAPLTVDVVERRDDTPWFELEELLSYLPLHHASAVRSMVLLGMTFREYGEVKETAAYERRDRGLAQLKELLCVVSAVQGRERSEDRY